MTGLPVAIAKAFTVESPTRRLVNEPGPKPVANPSMSVNDKRAATIASSITGTIVADKIP